MKLNVDLSELTAAVKKITGGKVFPYNLGVEAYFSEKASSENPYDKIGDYDNYSAWAAGWMEARKA